MTITDPPHTPAVELRQVSDDQEEHNQIDIDIPASDEIQEDDNQTLDRPAAESRLQSTIILDENNIYQPDRVCYPIYVVKVGIYRINFLSRPLTEEEMHREMPRLKRSVILFFVLLALSTSFVVWTTKRKLERGIVF